MLEEHSAGRSHKDQKSQQSNIYISEAYVELGLLPFLEGEQFGFIIVFISVENTLAYCYNCLIQYPQITA